MRMKQILAIGEALRQRLFAGSCRIRFYFMGKGGAIASYSDRETFLAWKQKGLSSYGNV